MKLELLDPKTSTTASCVKSVEMIGDINIATSLANEIVQKNKIRREKTTIGLLCKSILSSTTIQGTWFESFVQNMLSMKPITDFLTKPLTQEIIHSIEILSIGLINAIKEDKTVLTQQTLPMILYTLIGLQLAINEYNNILRQLYSFNRIDWLNVYRKQKSITGNMISTELQGILQTLDVGIDRLIKSYYDMIPMYPFPSTHQMILNEKRNALKNNYHN